MDVHLELFDKILETHVNSKSIQSQLLELIECLCRDLEFERSFNVELHKHLHVLSEQESFGITSKYFTLKEQNVVLKKQQEILKNENNELNIQIIAKIQEADRLVLEKEEEIANYYIIQIRCKDEEIKKRDEEIQRLKMSNRKDLQDLHNDMQTSLAASALEFEESECNLRKQISDRDKKIKDVMDTCNILRTELMMVKDKFSKYKTEAHELTVELQRRLKESHVPHHASIKLSNVVKHDVQDSASTSEISITGKYLPLEVTVDSPQNSLVTNRKLPNYQGFTKRQNEKSKPSITANPSLPLMQLKNQKFPVKKRRLYNPDDLSYLNLEISLDNVNN